MAGQGKVGLPLILSCIQWETEVFKFQKWWEQYMDHYQIIIFWTEYYQITITFCF